MLDGSLLCCILSVLNEQASVSAFTVALSFSTLRALGAHGSVLPAVCKPSSTAQTVCDSGEQTLFYLVSGCSHPLPRPSGSSGGGSTIYAITTTVLRTFTSVDVFNHSVAMRPSGVLISQRIQHEF